MNRSILCCLTALLVLGCSDESEIKKAAKDTLKATVEGLSETYDQAEAVLHAKKIIAAAENSDLSKLKSLCNDYGNEDYKEVMGCLYKAFALENSESVDAARKYITAEMRKEDNSPAKNHSLRVMNEYFAKKGSLTTKEVVAIVAIIGLEAQYPHRGAVIGAIISKQLGLVKLDSDPSDKSSTETAKAKASLPTANH